MLWDIIRDFIVQYITGGNCSNGDYYTPFVGLGCFSNGQDYLQEDIPFTTDTLWFRIGPDNTNEGVYQWLPLGDWLATTLTIIAMCLIVAFAIWLVRWVFKAVSSAFLLRR